MSRERRGEIVEKREGGRVGISKGSVEDGMLSSREIILYVSVSIYIYLY